MAAKFRAASATIRWHGTDDTTPSGHSIAIGTDSLGTNYLWLFKGEEPTDEAFVGSILVPTRAEQTPVAYGRGGGYVGVVTDVKATFEKLVARSVVG